MSSLRRVPSNILRYLPAARRAAGTAVVSALGLRLEGSLAAVATLAPVISILSGAALAGVTPVPPAARPPTR